jgi:hypothetical protein
LTSAPSLLASASCSALSIAVRNRAIIAARVDTLPREFLESLLVARGRDRPRLLASYREHLSQAFARYLMQVGLPVPVDVTW